MSETPTSSGGLPDGMNSLASTHLSLALSLGGFGTWHEDLAGGPVYLSEQALAILGRAPAPQGLTRLQVQALIHPDDEPEMRVARDRMLAGERSGDLIFRAAHVDGSWRRILSRRTLVRNAQGKPVGLAGVVSDITDRLQQADREIGLARQLELATAAAGLAFWSWSPGTGEAHWNPHMAVLHGLPATAQAPDFFSYFDRYVHPDDRELGREGLRTLMRQGRGSTDLELRIVPAGGGAVHHLSTRTVATSAGGVLRLHGIMLDISEQVALRERLRRGEERAALVARGAGIGTWDTDVTTGVAWWNDQMWHLRGLEPQPQPLQPAQRMALVHPDDQPAMVRAYADPYADQPTYLEFRVRLPDGRWRWLASRSAPVRDAQGKVVRRIGINWDVTASRDAEAERQERRIAEHESQAKSRFLARVSHELRTPLNAVLGLTQLLLADEDGPPDPAQRRERLKHVNDAGRHLLNLIDEVLELSSLESGERPMDLRPVALAPLVSQAFAMVRAQAEERRVSLLHGPLQDAVRADPVRLKQALLNLLTNGIKYNRSGGCVTVASHAEGERVVLTVGDTGRGMSEDQVEHLFEPFNRLGVEMAGIEGSGIGLAIVKAAVERMGGSVRVESSPGQGSRFELRLRPAFDDEPSAPGATTAPPPPPEPERPADPAAANGTAGAAAEPRKVLYIEDNEVNVLIVAELLARRGGIEFEAVGNGLDGVRRAREWQPALVLLDMQLPDIDGHEVLRRLRADPATAGLPCMALSANAMPQDIQRAMDAGLIAYWTKPLDFQQFLDGVDRLLGTAT